MSRSIVRGDDGIAQPSLERRSIVYCLIPPDLGPALHELLRAHFRDHSGVAVLVERRRAERRSGEERRAKGGVTAPARERRGIRSTTGRRIGERRATLVEVEPHPLPRRARAHADRILFVERLEPSAQETEDRDSARLAMRFQAGDQEAFTELYLRYFDRVYAYLRLVLRDRHEAEDATQQVFMKIFEALPRYERRRQPFRAWLFRGARNAAVDRLRKESRYELLEPDEIQRRSEEAVVAEDADLRGLAWITDSDLLLFVERLPVPQRRVLLLRYMLGLTTAETAKVLDRTISDVRVLQSRALRFLEARLTALGRAPGGPDRSGIKRRFRQAPVLRLRRFALGAGPYSHAR